MAEILRNMFTQMKNVMMTRTRANSFRAYLIPLRVSGDLISHGEESRSRQLYYSSDEWGDAEEDPVMGELPIGGLAQKGNGISTWYRTQGRQLHGSIETYVLNFLGDFCDLHELEDGAYRALSGLIKSGTGRTSQIEPAEWSMRRASVDQITGEITPVISRPDNIDMEDVKNARTHDLMSKIHGS